MFLRSFDINRKLSVSEIVAKDYRTAEVFRRYGIGYCCGGKWPMEVTCEMQGVNIDRIEAELENACRQIHISSQHDYGSWSVDFLMDFIINVHHQYLKKNLPEINELLAEFAKKHIEKFSWLSDLEKQSDLLSKQLIISMKQEEEVLFPYIRQIVHAHRDKESYALLLVKTFRKPVEEIMFKSHETITDILFRIRSLTNTYFTPENVCSSHKVLIGKLKELDNDIMQHLFLEQSILFPRSIEIEKEVLDM